MRRTARLWSVRELHLLRLCALRRPRRRRPRPRKPPPELPLWHCLYISHGHLRMPQLHLHRLQCRYHRLARRRRPCELDAHRHHALRRRRQQRQPRRVPGLSLRLIRPAQSARHARRCGAAQHSTARLDGCGLSRCSRAVTATGGG